MYHRYPRYEEEGTKKQLNRGENNARGLHWIGHNLKYFLFCIMAFLIKTFKRSSLSPDYPGPSQAGGASWLCEAAYR